MVSERALAFTRRFSRRSPWLCRFDVLLASQSASAMAARDLEPGIVTDLTKRRTYAGYPRLDELPTAEEPLSDRVGPRGVRTRSSG
jgi:hypothetical protein